MKGIRILLPAAFAVIWALAAQAQTWDCGKTPGSVTATFNDGTLTIKGTGAMKDYDDNGAPWVNLQELVRAVIQNGVTSIGDRAFGECSHLKSVTIPNSVTSIGNYAFIGLRGLESITIPNSVTSIGEGAFVSCESLTSIIIPNGVTSIGYGAFSWCNGLTSVTIGNSVTSIGGFAFNGCAGLTSVTIPNSVISIGEYAFYGCTGLTSVIIPNSVITIGDKAFSGCTGLTSIEVTSSNAKYISEGGVLFNKDKTVLIQYPASKQSNSYTIPESVITIKGEAFSGCAALASVAIPNGVTSIEAYTFNYCTALTSVIISNNVTSIGGGAFAGTGLTSVTIPSSVTSIEEMAFDSCTALTSIDVAAGNAEYSSDSGVLFNKDKTVLIQYPASRLSDSYTIPESVTSIYWNAFFSCTGLTAVTALNAVPLEIDDETFHSLIVTDARLYVPDGRAEDYHAAAGWRYFAYINDEFVGSVVSVATRDRIIPAANSRSNVTVTAPAAKLTAEFAAGPNPANKSSGPVTFFRRGGRIKSASLSVFDASGGVVSKIIIRDNAVICGDDRRQVGSWNLKDKKGRLVPDGTYLVRGTVTASNGKSEKVSFAVGVR